VHSWEEQRQKAADIITGDSLRLRLFAVLALLLLSINAATAETSYFIDSNYLYMPINISENSQNTYILEKTAGYEPNGSLSFPDFFDDFNDNDVSDWGGVSSSSVSNGIFTIAEGEYVYNSDYGSTSKIIGVRTKIDSINGYDSSGSTVLVNYQNNQNLYKIWLSANTEKYGAQALLSDSWGPEYYASTNTIDTNSWYDVEILDNNGAYSVRRGMESFQNVHTFSSYSNFGNIGLRGEGGASEFDYIYVRKYSSTEPTVTVTDAGTYYQIDVYSTVELTDYQLLIPLSDISVSSETESIKITQPAQIAIDLIAPGNNTFTNSSDLSFNVSGTGDCNATIFLNGNISWVGNVTTGTNEANVDIPDGVYSWYINGSATTEYNTADNTSEIWQFTYDSISPVASIKDINPDYSNVANGTIVQTNIKWTDANLDYARFYVDYGSGYTLNDSITFSSSSQWFNTSIDTTGHTGDTISWYQIAYDEAGNSYTYSDSFNVVVNALNIYVYDETTSESILPSNVVIYNEDISKEATISETTNISSLSYDGLSSDKYIVRVSADGYYSRRSILYVDIESLAELDVYLPSEDETVIFDQFALTDNTGSYDEGDCIIRLDKPLVDGTDTVFSSYFDFDGVASTYLIASDQYILYVETPDRTISYGWLSPDADGVIDIIISNTPVGEIEEWLNYSLTHDDDGVISFSYESNLAIDNVNFWVNASNGTNLYSASSSSDIGSFTYTGSNDSTYYASFSALSESGKTVDITRVITFTGSGVQDDLLNFLPEDAPDWLYNLIGGSIVVISVLMFGQFRMDVGCVISASLAGLFWYWGLLQIEGIVVAVGVIIAVAAVLNRSRRS
jgi:hypothetical protein